MDGESRRILLGGFMKKIAKSVVVIALALTGALSQAHPGAYGHGGYGHGQGHGGGWSRGSWVAPALAAGLIGGALYAGSHPIYGPTYINPPIIVNPAPTYMNGAPGTVAPVAYYCSAYQQYYPQVGSCPVPWQIVN
jgi:hypothetical protein